jgi:hypothetical protein
MSHPTSSPTPQASPSAKELQQQQLDDALADSFPASDPVSFVTSQAEEYWNGDAPDPAQSADRGERDASGVKKPAP